MNKSEQEKLTTWLKKYSTGKTKICFLTCEFPPAKGGVSKSASRITKFLIEEDYEVHVFAPNVVDSKFHVEIIEDGLYLYNIPSKFLPVFYQIISMLDKIINFDLFHGFFFFWSGALLPIIEKDKRPLISSIRGIEAIWMKDRKSMKGVAKRILKRSSWVTSVSTDSLSIAGKLGYIKRKSSFIANSVKLKTNDWQKNDKNIGVVGTVAVFRDKKNIPLLIESYSRIPKSLRTKLLLVGDYGKNDQYLRNEFENQINRLNIADEVVITGYVTNEVALEYLKLMNVFVISSDHEGLPNTLFEAAASGVPIVATAVDGIKDICTNNVHALLVPPKDANQMSQAIQTILSNDRLGIQLSKGGKELIKKYDINNEKKQWAALYRKLLNNVPCRPVL